MKKQGNGNVARSEESIMLMTPFGFPHHGSRSFVDISYDT